MNLGGFESLIHEKGACNNPHTEDVKDSNRIKPAIRACLEYVFGGMSMSMGGKLAGKVGLPRTQAWWGLKNLTYNLLRFLQSISKTMVTA